MLNKKILFPIIISMLVFLVNHECFSGALDKLNGQVSEREQSVDKLEVMEKPTETQSDDIKSDEKEGPSETTDNQKKPAPVTKKKAKGATDEFNKGIFPAPKDDKFKETDHFKKIVEIHPDFQEVAKELMFVDYLNNLTSQQFETAKGVIGSGRTEEVIKLLSDYKDQKSHQNARLKILKKAIESFHGVDRKSRSKNIVQNWLNENERAIDGSKVIDIKVRDISSNRHEKVYLISYIVAKGPELKEYSYQVDFESGSVRSVWLEERS